MNVSTTMRDLGIDKENFRTLGLLPLVFVAWADGAVQRSEESFIRQVARDKGWLVGSGEALLEGWLREPPDETYVAKGLALIKALAADRHGFAGAITGETLRHLLVLCKEVAEAAGGFWGLSQPISEREERALVLVAEAFDIGDNQSWRRIVSDHAAQPSRQAPGPRGHLLVGELPAVSRDPLGLLMRCFHEYGDVVRLPMPGLEWYLLSHPDHVKHVLVDHARNYIRGSSYDRFRLMFNDSIATTEGEQWRRRRRIAQPIFHRQSIASMAGMMIRCTADMVDRWADRPDAGPLDLAIEMPRLTLRIIGFAMFGVDLQDASTRELSDAMVVALEYMAGSSNPFRMPTSVPTRSNRRFARAMKVFESFVFRTLAQRLEDGERRDDLMSMMLDAVDPETGDGLTHLQIRNEMLTFLVAGHETSASTLTWMFYLLSKHPIVARRVDDEIATVLGGRTPTVPDLDALPTVTKVIQETMRIYPSAFMLPREVVSEDRIGGYTVPAKAWVLLSPYVTHRRPDVWDNPEGFDPDRFTPEANAKRHPCAYFPFFAGPHKCIGQAMAMMEIKLILTTILERCHLELWPGFEPGLHAHVALRARDGMLMQPRWSRSAS